MIINETIFQSLMKSNGFNSNNNNCQANPELQVPTESTFNDLQCIFN